jgi:GTP cyclohydrolase I
VSQSALSLVGLDQLELPDVQAEVPAVPIAVDEAGIADLRYPISVHLADGNSYETVATTSFAADVASDTRGVHMSRFVETLHNWRARIGVPTLSDLLAELSNRLAAQDVVVKFEFPLFLERVGPVSGAAALVCYDCSLEGRLQSDVTHCTLTTRVPVTSLCPCSREISDYGAHNQRGSIETSVNFEMILGVKPLDFGDLIRAAEEAGSAPIYTLLKRTDERHVTMQAYENPAFVEDIARAVAAALKHDLRVRVGRVRVVNEESIHAHNAFATIKWTH